MPAVKLHQIACRPIGHHFTNMVRW